MWGIEVCSFLQTSFPDFSEIRGSNPEAGPKPNPGRSGARPMAMREMRHDNTFRLSDQDIRQLSPWPNLLVRYRTPPGFQNYHLRMLRATFRWGAFEWTWAVHPVQWKEELLLMYIHTYMYTSYIQYLHNHCAVRDHEVMDGWYHIAIESTK